MNKKIIELIENSKMSIDFSNIETNTIDELRELINKYTDKYKSYKNRTINAFDEMKNIFGVKNDLIYKPKSDSIYNFIESPKPNLELWFAYKKFFYKNFDNAVLIRKQLQIQKRKADIQAYQKQYKKQKIICNICQGHYLISNKAKHFKTQKHLKPIFPLV
jgi:hypothetical protein